MLIEDDARMRSLEQLCEQPLAFLDWLAVQIPTVKLKQIEGAEESRGFAAVAANLIKYGEPIFVANDCFTVD
jgi:hypothetical protein